MTPTIRIDDDVYRALRERAHPASDTPNSVLRQLLSLPIAAAPRSAVTASRTTALTDMVATGALEVGDDLIWERRNRREVHFATVVAPGRIALKGGFSFDSPSAAAKHISGVDSNGWRVWSVLRTGQSLAEARDASLPPRAARSRAGEVPEGHFALEQGEVSALARREPDGAFVVVSAVAPLDVYESLGPSARGLRDRLISSGAFAQRQDLRLYDLVREASFESPSAAAQVLLGYETNGRRAWRDAAGEPLGQR